MKERIDNCTHYDMDHMDLCYKLATNITMTVIIIINHFSFFFLFFFLFIIFCEEDKFGVEPSERPNTVLYHTV